ncbi:MAG: DUF433 domain-containing protein [Alphaproteobacteria bacterium]|nr:DUF433 domain-containing protein [Alphaproteobacteria bacterium]
MTEAAASLIGVGIYTVAEASALTGVPTRTIRRWSRGYQYSSGETQRVSPPVWTRDLPDIGGRTALTFLDMMEARFIRAFREHNVSWQAIREAARIACELFQEPHHPFTRGRFRTDGRRIFRRIENEGSVRLFDLNLKHWVFANIVEPSLYRDVSFEDDQVAKWFPLFPSKAIVIDPVVAFGRPVTAREGVPTDVLAASVKANGGSVEHVARWYGVASTTVRAAVRLESQMTTRAAPAAAAA